MKCDPYSSAGCRDQYLRDLYASEAIIDPARANPGSYSTGGSESNAAPCIMGRGRVSLLVISTIDCSRFVIASDLVREVCAAPMLRRLDDVVADVAERARKERPGGQGTRGGPVTRRCSGRFTAADTVADIADTTCSTAVHPSLCHCGPTPSVPWRLAEGGEVIFMQPNFLYGESRRENESTGRWRAGRCACCCPVSPGAPGGGVTESYDAAVNSGTES
jgi:hypothetical protein